MTLMFLNRITDAKCLKIKVNEKHCEKYGIYNPRWMWFIKGHTEMFSIVFAEVASQSTSVKTSPTRLVSVCFVGVFTD